MIHVTVNGIEITLPETADSNLRDLLRKIRTGYSSESSLISSILVNGIEIDEQEEATIGGVPLMELRSIEVFTAHPKEIAEETLQSLIEFLNHLETLCGNAAALLLESPSRTELLPKLADGVTTFIDAVTGVKLILHVGAMSKVQVLEADLLSILKDMLHYQGKAEFAFVGAVIKDALIPNLETWRKDGIPSLIRLRDC